MMTIRVISRVLLSALLAAATMLASEVTGKWKASFTTPNGETRESTFDLKADGDKLTGTVSSTRGETAISDGKVDGNKVSFAVVRNFQGNEFKMLYKGTVSGDEMSLTVDFNGNEFPMTAKRQK
jgi:hypothetical protein